MRISTEAIGRTNAREDPLFMILYQVQNKLSLVGGHYGAPGGLEKGGGSVDEQEIRWDGVRAMTALKNSS